RSEEESVPAGQHALDGGGVVGVAVRLAVEPDDVQAGRQQQDRSKRQLRVDVSEPAGLSYPTMGLLYPHAPLSPPLPQAGEGGAEAPSPAGRGLGCGPETGRA